MGVGFLRSPGVASSVTRPIYIEEQSMDEAPRLPTAPPGLKAKDIRPDRGWRRYASPISVVLLGGIMLAALFNLFGGVPVPTRSEEQPYELQSLMRISYAVFCLKKKK